MSDTTITTNNVPRPIIYGFELSEKERKEFDRFEEELDSSTFFRYRGQVYSFDDFVHIVHQGQKGYPFAHYDHTGALKNWDGIRTDSFFSAVVVRFVDEESVIVGLALS